MKVGPITILINECDEGVYLRWWFNGWHYFNFQNGYELIMRSESMDTQVTKMFSVISKIERPTKLKAGYSYNITLNGITSANIGGFTNLLIAEKVEQYEGGKWYEVEITRGDHLIKNADTIAYIFNFEITRREIPYTSSTLQKTILLYLGDTLCDLDESEVIPVNKQVNDIAEMQDRQSDFTAAFRIRKTRAMKALFELSGEVGINTSFPYENQTCRLVQDSVEMITGGRMILDKVTDQYYFVSIMSGNSNFFKSIEPLRLTNLTLASTNHTWNVATMAGTHAADLDYVYPLCEPSDDGGISQLPGADDGDRVEMYGGWIWPFIKVKAIWDEIISNAGYICEGNILTNEMFNKLYMPIINKKIGMIDTSLYKYWGFWYGYKNFVLSPNKMVNMWPVVGTPFFGSSGNYSASHLATYKIRFMCRAVTSTPANVYIYSNDVYAATMTRNMDYLVQPFVWDGEYTVAAIGEELSVYTSNWLGGTEYTVGIMDIQVLGIAYGSPVTPRLNIPELTQVDFIKMVCNMFGLIPDVTPRDRKIRFWNYRELYDNIPIARDWSAYLSEREDEVEFKYGDYARDNYLRYKESEDVVKDQGMGSMQIDDDTLPAEKDVVELPVSTCDEVNILDSAEFSVDVSRIAFNNYNIDDALYDSNDTIDPRIVYVDHIPSIAAPAYEKTFGIRATVAAGAATDITSPKKASSLEVSFSTLIYNYSSLSRLLTKTNLRRVKFNLPVFEVAGLKHYIPIYISQYKAYFYVNKINNYVPGKLCTIDLIKL
ncbi:MAG TPA: hypothetical protein VMV77_08815 [Bacteroidales bacterium]|nr:hypothetical protein [Bacteroidales bacterium]